MGIFGFNLLQYLVLKYTTAINGSLINAATPIMTVVLSSLLIKEKMGPVQLAGILISFFGVGWVITGGSWEVLAKLKFNVGDLMVLVAVLGWSVYSIFGKKPTLQFSSVTVTA